MLWRDDFRRINDDVTTSVAYQMAAVFWSAIDGDLLTQTDISPPFQLASFLLCTNHTLRCKIIISSKLLLFDRDSAAASHSDSASSPPPQIEKKENDSPNEQRGNKLEENSNVIATHSINSQMFADYSKMALAPHMMASLSSANMAANSQPPVMTPHTDVGTMLPDYHSL